MSVHYDGLGPSKSSRRVALLQISPEVVLGLLHNVNRDRRITSSGLPADAEVVRCDYDFQCRCIVLTLESQEFEEVSPGVCAPYLQVIFTDHGPRPVSSVEEGDTHDSGSS